MSDYLGNTWHIINTQKKSLGLIDIHYCILWPPHAKSWLIGKDSDAGRDLGAGGEGDDRGWDGWMASLTWWTWVWVNSGSWWWTGRPGVLQFMGSKRVRHDWVTELNWTGTVYKIDKQQRTYWIAQGTIFNLGQEDHLEKEMATHSSILA